MGKVFEYDEPSCVIKTLIMNMTEHKSFLLNSRVNYTILSHLRRYIYKRTSYDAVTLFASLCMHFNSDILLHFCFNCPCTLHVLCFCCDAFIMVKCFKEAKCVFVCVFRGAKKETRAGLGLQECLAYLELQ